jgi:hypothetical protein
VLPVNPTTAADALILVGAAIDRCVPVGAARGRVIGIDGRSGAGKSTMATALGTQLGASVLALEDLYPGWNGLRAGIDHFCEWFLEPWSAGRSAGYRRYDWSGGQFGPWIAVDPAVVVIVEGVGAGALRCAAHLSLLAFLDRPADQRYERAMARDGAVFGPFWDVWAEQEEEYLRTDRPAERADLLLTLSD